MRTKRSSDARRRRRAVCAALVLAGCPAGEPEPDPEPVRIASIHGWTRVVDPATDVFAAMRPAEVPCDEAGYGLEQLGLSFEVKTDLCNYVTVRQATMAPLFAGDVLAIRGWHDVLAAPPERPGPTQGYLGLALDGELLWEGTFAIPGPFEVISADVEVADDVPQGAELQYHVHNHGINSWNLADLDTKVAQVDR